MKKIPINRLQSIGNYYVTLLLSNDNKIVHICKRIGYKGRVEGRNGLSVSECGYGLRNPGNVCHPTHGTVNTFNELREQFKLCPECGDFLDFMEALRDYAEFELLLAKQTKQ